MISICIPNFSTLIIFCIHQQIFIRRILTNQMISYLLYSYGWWIEKHCIVWIDIYLRTDDLQSHKGSSHPSRSEISAKSFRQLSLSTFAETDFLCFLRALASNFHKYFTELNVPKNLLLTFWANCFPPYNFPAVKGPLIPSLQF